MQKHIGSFDFILDTVSAAHDINSYLALLARDGTLTLVGGVLTYAPDTNYVGPDSFSYTVSDGVLTDSAIVTITVTPVNDSGMTVNAFSCRRRR